MTKISIKSNEHIKEVAKEVLDQFDLISIKAENKLADGSASIASTFASINTMTSGSAVQNLNKVNRENQDSYQKLMREPAIARVVVTDDHDDKHTYYICRTTPVPGFPSLASYRAPIGRLASLEIGSEFTLPNGNAIEVLERSQFQPDKQTYGWDSFNTIIESEEFGQLSIESLRALLKEVPAEEVTEEDILSQLMAEDTLKANIISGVRRNLITKMGLRDQPILDQYQDEIFRFPLNKRLLILGPPGTGKTTTLIRRLGQKLDSTFLDEGEKNLVEIIQTDQGVSHTESWLMFTPTELLKQYLKEAFVREGVLASDHRIHTWYNYQRKLARNVFGILRTSSSGGTFVLKNNLENLDEAALNNPIKWYEDFNTWQREQYVKGLIEAADKLQGAKEFDIQQLGKRLHDILTRSNKNNLASLFVSLNKELPQVEELVSNHKQSTDTKIKEALNLQLNKSRSFLDELADFIDGLQKIQIIESEEQDDIDADDEENTTLPSTGRASALKTYMQVARAQARASVTKRNPSKSSRTGKIIEWLDGRGLPEADCPEVGASLLIQSNARSFVIPVKRYLSGFSRRYRAFRRQRQKDQQWYTKESFVTSDIHPLEIDIILLAILRGASNLLSRTDILRNVDSKLWSSLQPMLDQYYNQILVDEATDFSAIQLACMAALAHPRLKSFFACGDFNQRLTTWGATSIEELKWIYNDLDVREINVSYRQSKELTEFAEAMIHAVDSGGTVTSSSIQVDESGVSPVLLENAEEQTKVISWLANRISEIERFVGQLPSIAIFVNSEDEVKQLSIALNDSLVESNIQVMACHEGQAVGQESNVRVFDIQYIKGLEFEAVFFVGIDQLAEEHPTLFEKYMYVGATRAATYLGVTCNKSLPASIESLRSRFSENWQHAE